MPTHATGRSRRQVLAQQVNRHDRHATPHCRETAACPGPASARARLNACHRPDQHVCTERRVASPSSWAVTSPVFHPGRNRPALPRPAFTACGARSANSSLSAVTKGLPGACEDAVRPSGPAASQAQRDVKDDTAASGRDAFDAFRLETQILQAIRSDRPSASNTFMPIGA